VSEVEAAGDTAAENRPDPGSHVRIKIYEIERHHPAQAEQLAEDPRRWCLNATPKASSRKKFC